MLLFANLIFSSSIVLRPKKSEIMKIVVIHIDNYRYMNIFLLLEQVLRYFTGMCTGCWYFVNGWGRHVLYWRKRSEHIRWTESSSCFGEVIASSIPTLASFLTTWFFFLWNFIWDSFQTSTCNFVLWTGLFIMAPIFLCLMMSSVQLMLRLLIGFYVMQFWVLLWSNTHVYFVRIMFRWFPWNVMVFSRYLHELSKHFI